MPDVEVMQRFPWRVPDPDMQPTVRSGRLRPLRDLLVVLPDEEEEQTGSGIVLPWTARDHRRAQAGTVLAAGPNVRDLRAGDRVLYRQWGGVEAAVGGQAQLLLRAHKPAGEDPDVFAVID